MLYQKNDKQHIKLTYVTHFYCDQSNIESVFNLLQKYTTLPLEIRQCVEFVIVDDGSPLEYTIEPLELNLTWLKIRQDIRWNQGGARNLGVTYAKSDKILLTDLDHELPEATFRYLIRAANPGRRFYKMYRTSPENGIYKGHSNLFFMSRARFLRLYGYDEGYSGNYGYEDLWFAKYQKYHGSRQVYLPRHVVCYERHVDRQHSYHNLQRDLSANEPIYLGKRQECESYGDEYGHSRLFLNFDWTILCQNTLFPQALPVRKRWWKTIWWLRYLLACLAR